MCRWCNEQVPYYKGAHISKAYTVLCVRNMWSMGVQSLFLYWGPLHSRHTIGHFLYSEPFL